MTTTTRSTLLYNYTNNNYEKTITITATMEIAIASYEAYSYDEYNYDNKRQYIENAH